MELFVVYSQNLAYFLGLLTYESPKLTNSNYLKIAFKECTDQWIGLYNEKFAYTLPLILCFTYLQLHYFTNLGPIFHCFTLKSMKYSTIFHRFESETMKYSTIFHRFESETMKYSTIFHRFESETMKYSSIFHRFQILRKFSCQLRKKDNSLVRESNPGLLGESPER